MSLAIATPNRWAQIQRGLRRAAPYALLAALATVVWWAGAWLLPPALFAVACWRAPDPQQVRYAVELVACAVVLLLTAVAVLIHCARGQTQVIGQPGRTAWTGTEEKARHDPRSARP